MPNWEKLKARARELKLEVHALALAGVDPRLPWRARFMAMAVVAYAVSPIDLIPDFVPVLGLLDDLLLLPLGIALTLKMIPPALLDECRARARESGKLPVTRGQKWAGVAAVVCVWVLVATLGYLVFRRMRRGTLV
jgi:uncharacterized membrane protein YkvA (DUF1232 family)